MTSSRPPDTRKKPAAAQQQPPDNKRRSEPWIFIFGLSALLLLLFRQVLLPGNTLFSMDDNVGIARYIQGLYPEAAYGGWYDLVRVGVPLGHVVTLFTPLLLALPAFVYIWANYAIYMLLGGIFMGLYLRERGCNWPAALLGVVTIFFIGSNFTLIYPGHSQKFAILMYAGMFLWLIEVTARARRARYALLAGGAAAFPFLHQPDVALFFALFMGAYALYVWFRERLFAPRLILSLALPMGLMALATLLYPMKLVYGVHVEDVAVQETETPEHQYDLATQWSWPPDELIDLAAPGYFGWRTGDPEGPYYGRVGRSPDWIPRQYWSPNHKGESVYIGLLPLIFVFSALWSAWARRANRSEPLGDVCFWTCAALAALLLSFGHYAPFYALFYKLPMVASIRNPNKFIQIFQMAIGILAAHGLSFTLQTTASNEQRAGAKPVIYVAFGLAAIFALAFLSAASREQTVAALFRARGWADAAAQAIAAVRSQALGHATLIGFLTGGIILGLLLLRANRRWFNILAWAAALTAAADSLMLARHYLHPTSTAYFEENTVSQILKKDGNFQRALMTHQVDFYNHWLTFFFPYHHIQTWNVTQMPREPTEYRNFRAAMRSEQNMRLWQLCAIGHILTPVAYREHKAQTDPAWRDELELLLAYQPVRDQQREFRVVPAQPGDNSAQGIYRFKKPAPRFALIGQWQQADDEEALSLLAAPDFAPLSRVLVAPRQNPALPEPSGITNANVLVRSYRAGNIALATQAQGPAMLRFAEKYDPAWRATVDGKPAQILRLDYLFQGVLLPAGDHEVHFEYMPHSKTIWLQFAAFALWLAVALFAAITAIAKQKQKNT